MVWNIFQPLGEKRNKTSGGQKQHANEQTPNNRSPPQLAPEPRAPTFKRCPWEAQRVWAFADDAEGHRLKTLWQGVKTSEEQPLAFRPGFVPFMTALRSYLENARTTDDSDIATAAMAKSVVGQQIADSASSPPLGQDAEVVEGAPTLAADTRGIPVDAVHGLAEVVLSASICGCGKEVAAGRRGGSSSASWAFGCPTHGLSAVSWVRILPSGTWCHEVEASDREEGDDFGDGGARVDGGGDCGRGGRDEEGWYTADAVGTARRRACLIETLYALSAACRWSHVRDELARLCEGGGIATGLASLCDALCSRVTELKRRQQGPFRRPHIAGSIECERAQQDLLFFAHCLAPLAGLVTNSAPAAGAWYDLVNAKTLGGTGLPSHPWVSSTKSRGGVVPSCCPVFRAADATNGAPGMGKARKRSGENWGKESSPAAGDDHSDKEEEEDLFLAVFSAANTDEWSAMLVGCGLVRSLVNSLQACLDVRITARGLDLTRASPAMRRSGSATIGGDRGGSCSAGLDVTPGAVQGADLAKEEKDDDGMPSGVWCLGCELETAQVVVMMALGALLSAHPLAARDRFERAGGALRVHRIISHQPENPGNDGVHVCVSSGPEVDGDAAAAPVSACPFLQEHCVLVALQMSRLSVRAEGMAGCVPLDVLQGAARVVGALSPAMLSTWRNCQGPTVAWGDFRDQPPRLNPTDKDERLQDSGLEDLGKNNNQRGVLSHGLRPLGLPGELVAPVSREIFGSTTEGGTFAGGESSSRSYSSTAEVRPLFDSSSYRLCGPRPGHPLSSSRSPFAGTGWVADRLQVLARDRGPAAEKLVDSVHSRLATSLDTNDIFIIAQDACRMSIPPTLEGNTGLVLADGGVSTALSPCPPLLLMGFYDGMLDIVGDCDVASKQRRRSAETSGTGVAGIPAGVCRQIGAEGAVLRSALACVLEIFVEPGVVGGAPTNGETSARGGGRDKFPARSGSNIIGRQEKSTGAPFSSEGNVAAAAIRQLLALKFLHQAVRRWPRLTVKLLEELGLWDVIFSERFLSGCACHTTCKTELLSDVPADAATTGFHAPGRSMLREYVVAWGLVHDGALLLLEAVAIVRCLLQLGPEEWKREHDDEVGSCAVGDQRSGQQRSSEIEKYVTFLARERSNRSCDKVAMQGCKWLRGLIAMEPALGASLVVPPSLCVASLCLAFKLCDRGNGHGSDDAWVSDGAGWPLVHASLSLAADMVTTNERSLFQAAVAYAVDADAATGMLTALPGKLCSRRATASMTSDTSSSGLHAASAWYTSASGGSHTPGSINSWSPRTGPNFSSCDTHVGQPPPRPPRPLPEVLFKAALEPRARRAVFYCATALGVEASREALASVNVQQRETAVAVLSGLVEGYICLCERAAVATVAGSAATDDGPNLLLDALHGACALMRSEAPRNMGEASASDRGGIEGTSGGAENDRSSRPTRQGDTGVLPLLQETFREHWASARLLVVLESIAGDLAASRSTPNSSSVPKEACSEIVTACLSLFTAMMATNSLGKKAIRRALSEHYFGRKDSSGAVPSSMPGGAAGWGIGGSSFVALAHLAGVVSPASMCESLVEMLMDGEVPECVLEISQTEKKIGRDQLGGATRSEEGHNCGPEGREEVSGASSPPEIRNPFVVPLIFQLLPDWPASEQEKILKVFQMLLKGAGGGTVNRSLCCDVQPALMDQLLDILPRLDGSGSKCEDSLQELAIDLVRLVGSHSINVAQLKKIFRLLQPLSAVSTKRVGTSSTPITSLPLQPPWMCSLLRALRGMMDDEPGPQRFFLLDGLNSGLSLPRMPHWPAQKGYTFCAWVRLEVGPESSGERDGGAGSGNRTIPVAEAPCLFSFCGEQRGQGVAACFTPLRKKRGSVQRGAAVPTTTSTAETPQQYALELRVGAGRKKHPAIVRFPGIVVTAGEWVFVAVAHAASRWGQRGEASVLVDSSWRTSASPFPRFRDGGVATASIACHCPRRAKAAGGNYTDTREGAGAKVAGRPVLCSLKGQMGPIYLFEGSVSESLLRGIRQLGPGYSFSFEPPQVDLREVALLPTSDPTLQPLSEMGMESPELNANGGLKERNDDGESRSRRAQAAATAAAAAARQQLHIEALSGSLTSRILLAYNPSVWGGEYFLDNTPEHNPVRWTNSGSQASSTRGGQTERRQMIYSMAGSQAHVLVHPPAVCRPRAGDDGGDLRARRARHGPAGGPSTDRPDAAGRSRGWSGCSGGSGVDIIDYEGERAVFVRPRRRPGHMHAMRLPGTRECVTRDVRDALDCLGGVKVLLPLFAQYDHGVHRGGAARVSYRTDPRLNENVLALLVGTLRDSVPNQRFLRRYGGLSLIPFCLERVSPQHMNAGALAQACRLADRLGAWSEDWADSAIESLLSPSRLWVFAPTEAQMTLVGVLRGLARRCPGRMRRVVGVQQCLDALDLYYWYTPPANERDDVDPSSGTSQVENPAAKSSTGGNRRNRGSVNDEGDSGYAGSKDWSYVSRQWVHPSTGEVLGVKASGAVLGDIRARLLDTVVLMACDGDGVCRADVAAMLGFLRSCRDDLSRCEALRLILRFTDDPHQAGRFVVASGYVATEDFGGEADDDSPGRGPGRGGTAVSLFLSLVQASDPTVRLLAFLALGQTLIACLRIDSGGRAVDNLPDTDGPANQQFSARRHNSPQDSPPTTAQNAFAASAAASTSSPPGTSTPPPSSSIMVEFAGAADAKAEELVVLTGAPSARESAGGGNADEANSRRGQNSGSGGADVLELRGGVWEHVGLPRHKINDVLQWAQRQVTGAEQVAAAIAQGRSWEKPDGRLPRTVGSSEESKRRPEEEAAAESVVARVTMEVLQGLLIGQLPRGFAASVVDSREHPGDSKAPTVSPATDQPLDPFFLESPPSFSTRKSRSGDRPSAPLHQRSRPRSWRTGPGRSSGSSTSVPPPLCIHLPEAFPALCQQVAMAPLGAALRGEAIETLVAAVQSQRNAEIILCVDSWQQYLLSVVSSAQGRQAVATAAASASGGENYPTSQRGSMADCTAGDGDSGRHDRRIASDEAAREDQLVDRTVRLICWLAMCKARNGKPGRPGAGFAELQDTMSFLRCQGELGTMACMSVGESMLRYMVRLLKRDVEYLESEVNGWARGSHLPSHRPMLGSGGGHHGAAAVLACVWPLAALVVEFVTIPPVANPPAVAAANAPTPSAAALAVVTAAISDDGGSSRSSGESLICQSPIQGILQWLDTGMLLPPWPSPPPPVTPDARAKVPRTDIFSRELPSTPAEGWRAWELLDATVDLIGPTGDTLLWDARYRQGLCDEAGATSGIGKAVHAARTVDPGAEDVLDWGRRECRGLGSSAHARRSAEDRGTPSAPRRMSGGGGGGGDSSGTGFFGVYRATRFIDSKGKTANALADAGDVPWMLVRILLAVFVGGGTAGGHTEDDTLKENPSRRKSGSIGGSSGKFGGASGKGGGGAGNGPPSTALVALQRLIALLNSLESSGYEHLEFEVLNVAARVSTALRTTCLTPKSAWVLGALQLLAKCLATQGAQIEDLIVAAEERLIARDDSEQKPRAPSAPRHTSGDTPALQPVLMPRARLSFSRRSKPKFWLWDLLTGGGGNGSRRRRITPEGVLHQIAAETPSLAAVPSADLALEIIGRTLGIELPCRSQQGQAHTRKRGSGVSNTATAAPLTWDLLEAAFEPISEDGAGHEATGLARRFDRGGMHKLALQTLGRVRALEGRGGEAGIRVPADVLKLMTAVKGMETSRASALAEAKERATTRRQAQWEVVLKQLATERGPWGRGVEALGLDSVYWTLSTREDDHGRRLKLIRNPSGSLHTIASERTRGATRTLPLSSRSSSRAAGGRRTSLKTLFSTKSGSDVFGDAAVADGTALRGHAGEYALAGVDEGHEVLEDRLGSRKRSDVREMSAQTSLWRDLCKYQQKSLRVRRSGEGLGEQAEETEEEEEEEEDEEQEYESEYGEDDPGSSSDAEESSDVGVARDGSRRNRPDTSATFSSAGDVVRASCVTPGTILVEGHRLVFTRLPDANATSMEGENAGGGGNRQGGEGHDNYRWALRPAPTSSWSTSGLRRMLFRPYGGMRFAALEMWFRGGGTNDEGGAEGSLLLGLPSDSLANSLFRALRRTRPPSLEPFLGRLPATVVARSKANTWGASAAGGSGMFAGAYGDGRSGTSGVGGGGGSGTKAVSAAAEMARTSLTQAWARRRCGVTNFDYLRGLNAAAGRTTSDLSRYPVFPWVLSERAWAVEELDLKDERNFRDLAWPMGAQRPEQREMLHMRFTELERSYLEEQSMGGERAEMALPPFHHGTHYSTSAYVMWFLMRLEPFTSLHIHLQDGRFDKADRLFQSLPDAYRSCTHNPGDVKEAIPELYYLPELFVNATGFDLGCTQATGKPVGDVELPRWAHGDPWEFVRRHRDALESEHVSLRLHRWIDLVFGCRQLPPALDRGQRGAVDSCNVFFHLTYPGAVDLPRLREQDSQLYESTMRQIEEFGQAPAQLFKSPHHRRLSIAEAEVVRPLASPVPGSNTEPLPEANIPSVTSSSTGVAAEVDGASSARTGTAPPPRSHNVVSYPRESVSRGAVLVVIDLLPWAERLVTVDTRRAIGFHGWRTLPPERSPPFRLRAEAVEVGDDPQENDGGRISGDNGGGGLVGAGGGGAGPGGAGPGGAGRIPVRRFGVPFAPDGVASSRLLEPPPLDSRCGDYGLVGDDDGDVVFTRPLGGLGGSHVSLASMGSLLSLPQASVPASQPPQQLSYPEDQHAKAKSSSCPSSGGPPLDAYDGHHHDDRQQDHEPAGSPVPVHTRGEGWNRRIGVGVGGGVGLGSHLFAVLAESYLLFSGGHWDSSFRATALDTGRLVVSIARHRDVVTSLSLADGGKGCRRLVTASRDTTLMVWRVEDTARERAPPVSPSSLLHVLYGHDTPVTCVCARADLDAVVSSGEDGTVVVHTLWGGEYVRTITPQGDASPTELTALDASGRGLGSLVESAENGGHGDGCSKRVRDDEEEGTTSRSSRCPGADGATATPRRAFRGSNLPPPWASVEWVGLSAAGYVVAYSPADATLRSYTVNGHPLGAVQVMKADAGPLRAFVFSEDGTVLLSGGHDRVVTLRWAYSLALADDGSRKGCGEAVLDGAGPPLAGVPAASAGVPKFASAVRALALTAGERHLLVGLEDGTLGVLALDANYLRQRLRSKLDQLGI